VKLNRAINPDLKN